MGQWVRFRLRMFAIPVSTSCLGPLGCAPRASGLQKGTSLHWKSHPVPTSKELGFFKEPTSPVGPSDYLVRPTSLSTGFASPDPVKGKPLTCRVRNLNLYKEIHHIFSRSGCARLEHIHLKTAKAVLQHVTCQRPLARSPAEEMAHHLADTGDVCKT